MPPHWDIDHLCYRVETLDRYRTLKQELSVFAFMLTESSVNGRPIATYKLHRPIQFFSYRIDIVELPAPKLGKIVTEGFEHIEVVCDVPFAEIAGKYAHLNLDFSGLKKDFNQELEISLGERNLKFHPLSLESVVRLEGHSMVWNALTASKVLSDFKKFSPLVAGSIPLGLGLPDSDLDILMCAESIDEVAAEFVARQNLLGPVTVTENCVGFCFQNVDFEIFVDKSPSIRQIAQLHFQIEERLLKYLGEEFRRSVMDVRNLEGLKTEAAFAKVLGRSGDAFEALLDLQVASHSDLVREFSVVSKF